MNDFWLARIVDLKPYPEYKESGLPWLGKVPVHWSVRRIGQRINLDILKHKRAGYGEEIVVTLSRQLGWSHFVGIMPIKDDLKRDFYAEMARMERWSVRTLRTKIDSMLFERTALSRKPDKLIAQEINTLREEDKLTPDLVFRDPYLIDFLGLKDTYTGDKKVSPLVTQLPWTHNLIIRGQDITPVGVD